MLISARHQSHLKIQSPNLLLFIALTVALLFAAWSAINAIQHEVGDFAANSVLIQDAKQLRLVYGNYSRLGFNHPGPAILYVLAAGELFLHDWLHLLPSPFSGQLVAVCFYNAAWMTLIFAMVRRLSGAVAPAFLFIGVLVLAAAHSDYRIFTGIWFPHLYFFPYAAMLVAVSRLLYGRTDMLRALAISSGFLINGHASFIATLMLVMLVVLASNWLVTRRDPHQRILSRAFLAHHRRELRAAGAILLLFLLPLLIVTVRDFPGPLWDYAKFGRGSKGNTLAQALTYTSVYWGSGMAMVWGLLLIVLLVKGVRGPERQFMRDARGLGVALVAATIAVLFYVKKAVDQLDQPYIGLFYYAVPMLTGALVVLYVYQATRNRRKAAAAWVLGVAALANSWHLVRQAPDYDHTFNRPGVVELYQQLHALPGSGRIVLDLTMSADWGEIWGSILGVQAYARRQGVDLFCINQHWHISNTRQAACRPEELATSRRYLVQATGAPHPELGDAEIEQLGLALYREGTAAPAPMAPYVTVQQQPQYFVPLLGEGWSSIGGEFIWSVAPVAHIELPADSRRGDEVTLDLGSFMPDIKFRQSVQIWLNGRPVRQLDFNAFDHRRQIRIALGAEGSAKQHIEVRIARPVSPAELGLSSDARKLGVSLYGIRIKEKA